MSWLYEHRDKLEGLGHFAEIAYRATYGINSMDRDDLEQEIVLAMIRVLAKRGRVEEAYFWGIARTQIKIYWSKQAEQAKRVVPLFEDSGDDDDDGQERDITDNIDIDSRLDALAILATLPKRLIEIGYKRLDGEKLNSADREYWYKTKKRVKYEGNGCHLSEDDKRRIERLYRNGWSVHKVAKTTGRNMTTVRQYLYERGLREIGEVPAQFRKDREDQLVEV